VADSTDIFLYPGEASPNDVRLRQTNVAGAFDAATYSAVHALSESFRNVRDRSLYLDSERHPTNGDEGGTAEGPPAFDPSLYNWTIPSTRILVGRYWSNGAIDLSWLANESALTNWTIPSDRAARTRSLWPDTNQPTTWLSSVTPIIGWALSYERMAHGLGPRADTNTDHAWLAYPSPIIGWNAPTDRQARAMGRWAPETNSDNAWIFSVLPVPFDGAIFPGIAELVGSRTPPSPRLAVAQHWAWYDLSWLHDVIPLTDPVAPSTSRPRPIAPIMSARRRKKRRR